MPKAAKGPATLDEAGAAPVILSPAGTAAPAITMLDAYGRRRSSRSVPTGPGSRGGHWHDPAFRADYYRRWRAAHPEYKRRRTLQRAAKRREEAFRREQAARGEAVGPTPQVRAVRSLLSPRQTEILRLRARGLHRKEVAHRLGISDHTVRRHLQVAYEALGAGSLVEAMQSLGWVPAALPRRER